MPFVSKKHLTELKERSEILLREIEKIRNHAYLIGIERQGRVNVFTFARGQEMHKIETMGLISDDLPAWKERLLR